MQGVQGMFLQGFVAFLGCGTPPLSQKDPSCLALPSSHLPSPIPMCFFIFSLFPLVLCTLRWVLPLGLCVWGTAVSLTRFCTASDSVGGVNVQCHVQYVAQMFLPPPALSHAICSVADNGLEIWGRQSTGWEAIPDPPELVLTLLHVPFGWARGVLCVEVDILHLRGGFPWVKAVLSSQNASLDLLWALSLPGHQKEGLCASQLSVLMSRNTSANIFIVKILSNLWDTLCLFLACLKRLFSFSELPVWPKYNREEERVNNNISRTETFPTNTRAMR